MRQLINVSLFGLLMLITTCRMGAAATILANNGKSNYRILIPAHAPDSVEKAAQELQLCLEASTGAKLPIIQDAEEVDGKFISLGMTRQAENAGLQQRRIGVEGFSILTRGSNLYIWGEDTPDGAFTENGGTSNGTTNGVYAFLEDYLGVRWLMPGDLGRDVPHQSVLTLPEINRTESPFFINRRESYIQNETWLPTYKSGVTEWERRMKLGFSFKIASHHNWTKIITPDYYEKHPDWFAMIDGKRIPPEGNFYKLETTNPEVVRLFADKAIAALKANPTINTFSLSPSDLQGWSQSAESKALYDPPHHGYPSVTPLMVQFYRDVARIVHQEYPQGKLSGFIYWDYVYPPTKGDIELPENFYPVVAPEFTYGYTLYRDDVRADVQTVLEAWSKAVPNGHLFYSDLPSWLNHNAGLITPAAPEILNYLFPLLAKANARGIYLYGEAAWSQSAMSNYILAKMMWNPHLDAYQLQREWLRRAYGDAAGAKMELLYQHLDSWFSDYYCQHADAKYVLTKTMFQDIYAAHYPELENLFLQAEMQPMSAIQAQRLQLIKDNLIVLCWRLKNAQLLELAFKPVLQRSNNEIAALIQERHAPFDYFPGILPVGNEVAFSALKIKKVQLDPNPQGSESTFALPNNDTFLLYAARDGKIRITPEFIDQGMWITTYLLQRRGAPLKDAVSGVLIQGNTIEFDATSGQEYLLYLKRNKDTRYALKIDGGVATKSTFDKGNGILSLGDKGAPVYVYGNPKNLVAAPDGIIITTASAWDLLQRQYQDARSISLTRQWRFSPETAGMENAYESNFDGGSWKVINAGDWWQRQGYNSYHGKAWYRKKFTAPALAAGRKAILHFGGIDGNAEVFLNGQKVGEHLLAKDYTGWDEPFWFDVTRFLNAGDNTLAILVTSKSSDTASGIHREVNLLIGRQK